MSIDTKKIIERLGTQTQFVPTRTDNLHAAKRKGDKYHIINANQVSMMANSDYDNLKILASSAPEGFSWFIIDYDDKRKTGTVANLSQFELKPTFTIKTPTGAGKQEWYLIDEDKANKLPKAKYTMPGFEGVEFLLGHRHSKRLFVAPGCKKKDVEYIVKTDMPLANFPSLLYNTLLTQTQADNTEFISKLNSKAHVFEAEVDDKNNKMLFIKYITDREMEYLIGTEEVLDHQSGGRDDLIFNIMCEGFTYNLSKEFVKDIVTKKIVLNTDVMLDPEDEFNSECIDSKVTAAHNYIQELGRSTERIRNEELKTWKKDDCGRRTITHEQMEAKASFLSGYAPQYIMDNNVLRGIQCELIVKDHRAPDYLVGKQYSRASYDMEYAESIKKESTSDCPINFLALLQLRGEIDLHWVQYDQKALKETFRLTERGTVKDITKTDNFLSSIFTCKIKPYKEPNIIYQDEFFYPKVTSSVTPTKDGTPEEFLLVHSLLQRLSSRIVGTINPERDQEWLFDRFATLLQDPQAKIDNAVIFWGEQGSGKTSFIELMMHLFPREETVLIPSKEDLLSKFTPKCRITHVDDIDINVDKVALNELKSRLTSTETVREEKFKPRQQVIQPMSLTITTNDPITEDELLKGRRWTVFRNTQNVIIEHVRKDIRDILVQLKADDWRLLRVMHQWFLEREVVHFQSNYKSEEQKIMIAESQKGNEFTQAIANMIANYGYIDQDHQVAIPKKGLNKNDFNALMVNHYGKLAAGEKPDIPLQAIHGQRTHMLFSKNKKQREYIKRYFDHYFPVTTGKYKSRIGGHIGPTNYINMPVMKTWIKLLALAHMDSTEEAVVQTVINTFGFYDQWDWDNKTKPEIENLGNINIFDHIDLGYDDDDEDDEEF